MSEQPNPTAFTPQSAILSIIPPEGASAPKKGLLIITQPYDAVHSVIWEDGLMVIDPWSEQQRQTVDPAQPTDQT